MAAKNRLLLLLLLLLLRAPVVEPGDTAGSRSELREKPTLFIECGSAPDIPSNITHIGDRAQGFYTKGRQLQCRSHLQRRGQSYAHVITDVFARDCGGKPSGKRGYSIVVHLQTHGENHTKEESLHALSCYYDTVDSTLRQPVQLTDQTDLPEGTPLEIEARPITRNQRDKRSSNKKDDMTSSTQTGVAFPKEHNKEDLSLDVITMTSAPSVLQLNVIDRDGSMTTFVYPGKQVALELHTAHHTPFGVPLVRECSVSNPLEDTGNDGDDDQLKPFSATIIQHGCGLGGVLPKSGRFAKGKQGYTTPFFSITHAWTMQTALLFSCDVIICADVRHCHQSCPIRRKTTSTPRLHDVTVVLESQVVTSCPSIDSAQEPSDLHWSDMLLPECLPGGHRLKQPLLPLEPDQNFTAEALPENDVSKSSSSSSWLAGHLHYVIIIVLLALLIVVFMFATFCKMVAMQRQVERSNKTAASEQRERTTTEQHDQTTQTPRPLPRIPNGRAQTAHRLSRQGGDGAPTTVVHVDDGGPGSRPLSGGAESPPFDDTHDPLHPPTVPHAAKSSGRPRPKPYDVPPSHDRQVDIASSVEPVTPLGPFTVESSLRSSEVKSFQTSTTVEEKNSERHTTIIEIKNPCKQDSSEPGVLWKPHDHLGSFTGSHPNSGSSTPERGVVLGVNSLRRHLDREHQPISAQARDRRPISAQHHETMAAQVYYNTPAPCSEDSAPKDQFRLPSRDGGIPEHTPLAGIRTSTRGSRKGVTPIAVNMAEETTRL